MTTFQLYQPGVDLAESPDTGSGQRLIHTRRGEGYILSAEAEAEAGDE